MMEDGGFVRLLLSVGRRVVKLLGQEVHCTGAKRNFIRTKAILPFSGTSAILWLTTLLEMYR